MTETLLLAALLSMSEGAVVAIPDGMAWLWRRRPEDQLIVESRWIVRQYMRTLVTRPWERP